MKYLLFVVCLFSTAGYTQDIPSYMKHASMASVEKWTTLIADVTIEYVQGDYILSTVNEGGKGEAVIDTNFKLYAAQINAIKLVPSIDDVPILEAGDRIFIRQWGDGKDQYNGVPRLEEGENYYLYLYDTYFFEETTGAPIYTITGVNDGLFRKNEGGDIYRDTSNTSAIQLTD